MGSFFISIIYPLSSTWLRNVDLTRFNLLNKIYGGKSTQNSSSSTNNGTSDNKKDSTSEYEQLEYYLANDDGREIFKRFLVREFNVEQLMFYIEVQYYKKMDEDDESFGECAKNIYDTYVHLGAPFEINIPGPIRDEIARNIDKISMALFDKAEAEVYRTMEQESFMRFKKSNLYAAFIEKKNK